MINTLENPFYVVNKAARQLDKTLDAMAEKIQLDDSRYDRMKTSYEAVKDWIESDELFFKKYIFDVYPHGSVRILTTVKPLKKEEFDLDIVIHIYADSNKFTPSQILKELKRRLSENETYRKMLEEKNRCIRLNYAGDFHMDIMPGVHDSIFIDATKIKVSDRGLGSWVSSDPKGYAKWFHTKADLAKESLLEKALKAENLPANNFKHKKPLQRAVQLIKRYRDLFFQNNTNFKTSSIVLTTICGNFYEGDDSIYGTVEDIISKIIRYANTNPYTRIKVLNPVNPDEDFTDKWDSEPEYYASFIRFCKHLHQEWGKLKKGHGVIEESKILKGLFGDDLYLETELYNVLTDEEKRQNQNLFIDKSSGNITSVKTVSTLPILKNTFYGGNSQAKWISKVDQVSSLRSIFPCFKITYINSLKYKIVGNLKPTPRSCEYKFEIIHKTGSAPHIRILSPKLQRNNLGYSIPHIYTGDKLCLYRPSLNEFLPEDLISEKIVPWISLWLYYYEKWQITGVWLGGGDHPEKDSKSKTLN